LGVPVTKSGLHQLAKALSANGKQIYIMPTVNSRSDLYKYLFDKYGAYPPKCPDLLIGEYLVEFKSHTGKMETAKIGNMLTSGVKQSNRIILDLRQYNKHIMNIQENIIARIKNGQEIKEVLGWMSDGSVIQIYP
jgi:hypothetical protein